MSSDIHSKEENLTDFIDIQEMNLTLGKPMYTEIFTVPKFQNDNDNNLTSSVYSFSGNETLNGMKIFATGNGVIVPREDGVIVPLLMAEHFLLQLKKVVQVILLKQ